MRRDDLRRILGRGRFGWSRRRDGPIVLLYHRVARVPTDPQLLAVTPEHFAEQLEVVATQHEPVRLGDLVAGVRECRVSPRAVAITFDDGYADNLLTGKPLLERKGVPATVFVASGFVGGRRLFWWDELERLLLRPGRLPSKLTLELEGETLSWELGADATYGSARAAERAGWSVLAGRHPGIRQRIYRDLCARLRALDDPDRESVLEQLEAISETDDGRDGETGRPLSHDELGRLADGGLVEVGAHTVTHPVLSQLAPERQKDEVSGSKQQLEEALGRPISSFSYPYGTPADFDEATVSLVRAAGFDHACANVAGRVDAQVDPFRLPRVLVRDWSGADFARRLSSIS